MKDFFSVFAKRLGKSLAVATLMVSIVLLSQGNGGLVGALLLGYFTGGIFVGTMAYRTWRSAGLSAGRAKREMYWGLALRMGALLLVLFVAVHISVQVFSVTVLGFLLFYALAVLHLIRGNMEKKP